MAACHLALSHTLSFLALHLWQADRRISQVCERCHVVRGSMVKPSDQRAAQVCEVCLILANLTHFLPTHHAPLGSHAEPNCDVLLDSCMYINKIQAQLIER